MSAGRVEALAIDTATQGPLPRLSAGAILSSMAPRLSTSGSRKRVRAKLTHYSPRELDELRELERRADAGLIRANAGTALEDAMAKVEVKRAKARRG